MKLNRYILILISFGLILFIVNYALENNKAQTDKFPSKVESEKIAKSKFNEIIQENNSMVVLWKQSILGDPILVKTLEESPSYWSVPVIYKEKVIGFIDIEGDRTISKYGFFYENPDNLSNCPSILTITTSEEALNLAKNITDNYPGAKISDPVFIHDGAKSKTAWMLKLEMNDKIITRVFVAGNYVYERTEEVYKNTSADVQQPLG